MHIFDENYIVKCALSWPHFSYLASLLLLLKLLSPTKVAFLARANILTIT
jgi:hypothetical protein